MNNENFSPRRPLLTAVVLASVIVAVNTWAMGDAADNSTLEPGNEQQAVALVQQFAGQLKPKLVAAINEGGPVHAIEICASEAPKIAAELSAQSGWRITRVSSRNRNPTAVPDAWEAAAIKTFQNQLDDGADPTTLTLGETTHEGYRFAKPQIAEPLCLTCHGQNLAPEVSKALANYYPQDKATGYEAGQIRGIFSLLKPN